MPQQFPKEFPFAEPEGCREAYLLHACVASSRGLPGRTRAPRAEDQLACVVRFFWPGLGADTCPLLPGANERDEQDGLPRPLPGAKDLARAVAAFADLQVSFFTGAWRRYPPGWSPRPPCRWRLLEARPRLAAKEASPVPLRVFCLKALDRNPLGTV